MKRQTAKFDIMLKTEREAAYALQSILIDTYTKQNFKLQTVYTPTPNYISIFLAS